MFCRAILPFLLLAQLPVQDRPSSCSNCPTWNVAQPGFRLFGNTYYVGTHGLSSILITSPQGHILIDAALPESVPRIVDNIRSLGFRVEDIKLILNSHVHFDHGGGLVELQRLSGARMAASPWSADAMMKGVVPRDDPQFGAIIPSPKIETKVRTFKDGAVLEVGSLAVTAHYTPGHTPGGTSWTWRACEKDRCLNMVYADSLSAVSEDGFLFSRRSQYPHAEDFEGSFAFLARVPCDLLITPHPEASGLWDHLEQRKTNPEALVNSNACRIFAGSLREKLKERLATERKQ